MTEKQLPLHWECLTANQSFSQISTTHKKVKTKDCQPEGLYPVIDQGQEPIAGYVDDEEKVISVDKPVCIFGDHTRAVKWVDHDFVPGADGTKVLSPKEFLDPRFAYYQLKATSLPDKGYSRHFKYLKEAPFLVPPLEEQTRIANKLDELLAQVDTIKARVDAIPGILKRFRQSVLAAAVSGRLTEEWRGGVAKPAPAEYESWVWGEVPAGWSICLYPDVVESRLGKMLDKSKNTGKATSYLGNINVRWFGFDLAELQEILVSDSEIEELSIRPGDVLICEGGEPGRCAIWQENTKDAIVFQKALHRARTSDALLPEWLVINLKNDADRNTLNQLFTGTTIKHLTGKALKKYPLRVPPVQEQREIMARVDSLMSCADLIESRVTDGQNSISSLTQSILVKAFRGELVAQDPD